MKLAFRNTRIFLFLAIVLALAACSPSGSSLSQSQTSSSNEAGPTPTPFQPKEVASLYIVQQMPQAVPTFQPAPTVEVLPQVSVTTDPAVEQPQAIPTIQINMDSPEILNLPDTMTFLLLGSDTRGGASFRTDTMMIVIVRPKDANVSIISIPRDLWVNIPEVGEQRINVAYQYGDLYDYPGGGAGLLKDTILYNLGIQIDQVAMVDFNGFRRIVDTIGGIQLPVFCSYTDWRMIDPSLDPELEESWQQYTVEPGIVKMDGDLALWYARSRKMSDDFDRGRRQQEVIRAILQQGIKAGLITKIPQLYNDLSSSFTTDIGVLELVKLAPIALNLSNANIRSYYIAGEYVTDWVTDQGAYILLPNTDLIHQLVLEAMSPSVRQQEQQKVTVEVLNGSAIEGLDVLAAERLNYAGYQTIISPIDRHDYQNTLVYDLTKTQDRSAIGPLLAALNLDETYLVGNAQAAPKTPYAVVVGNDYDACFDPASLNP